MIFLIFYLGKATLFVSKYSARAFSHKAKSSWITSNRSYKFSRLVQAITFKSLTFSSQIIFIFF
jgi:hypothetical protein